MGGVTEILVFNQILRYLASDKEFVLLPFLCKVNVFLRQDGENLVKHLVWVCLTSQSHIVLCLEEDTHRSQMLPKRCVISVELKQLIHRENLFSSSN